MKGKQVTEILAKKLKPKERKSALNNRELSKIIGFGEQQLSNWKSANLTATKIANLVVRAMDSRQLNTQQTMIKPIVEFFDLNPDESQSGKYIELFSSDLAKTHSYLGGLKEELKKNHGVYIFYDSRGRALYAGKALKSSLWTELKSAFNRERDVQNIRRVAHPQNSVAFKTSEEKRRQISSRNVSLGELATYMSVYAVPDAIINMLEALLVRGFANDLLNVRMEHFSKPAVKKTKPVRKKKTR